MIDPDEFLGKRFGKNGRYLVKRLIGHGGMGAVFEALDSKYDRPVAFKAFIRDGDHAEYRARFIKEGKQFKGIEHPNVAEIYGLNDEQGHLSIVSEFIDGENLLDYMKGWDQIDVDLVLDIAEQVADGLRASHLSLIHI